MRSFKLLVVLSIMFVMAIATNVPAFELDQAFVELETNRTAVENLIDSGSYKEPNLTTTIRGTVVDLGLGEVFIAGIAKINTDFAFDNVPYRAELGFRFIDGNDFAAECYLSHDGDIDGIDNGQTVGCRAGLLGYN